jgi:hypothetical protein
MSDTPPPARDDLVAQLVAHLEQPHDRDAAPDAEPGDLLTAITAELRAESTWSGPPPGLRDTILAQARATAPPPADSAPAVVPPAAAIPTPGPRPRRRWAWPQLRRGGIGWAIPVAALVAALVAVVFTVAALAVDRALQPAEPTRTVYAATGAGLAPQASAEIGVADAGAGFSLQITAKNLPAAAPGSYYAAWLHGPLGTVPLGSFHQRVTGKPVTLWSGVDPADYPDFTVTLQAEGDPPSPSDRVVLTATLKR